MIRGQQALFGIDKLNVPRSDIPSVTHVDYSARIQTVHADTNPRYHALLTRFKERTGCPRFGQCLKGWEQRKPISSRRNSPA